LVEHEHINKVHYEAIMNNIKLSPAFLLIFSTVLGLTAISGGTSLWLASQPNLSEHQVKILEDNRSNCDDGFKVIFGLLGAKAIELLESDKDEDEDKE
jgi:hypothetical protein